MSYKLPKLRFYYTNYKGHSSYRTVAQPSIYYGSTEYHKKEQWLLKAYDCDKEDIRVFALEDCLDFISIEH